MALASTLPPASVTPPMQSVAMGVPLGSGPRETECLPGEVPVDQILPNPHQPRRQFNEPGLAERAGTLEGTDLDPRPRA